MVEGGAGILTSFYSRPDLVDCLCVTIAPKLLLRKGLPAISTADGQGENDGILDTTNFRSTEFVSIGCDSVFLARMQSP